MVIMRFYGVSILVHHVVGEEELEWLLLFLAVVVVDVRFFKCCCSWFWKKTNLVQLVQEVGK